MKKKIIIAGAILIVLTGGIGAGYTYVSYRASNPSNSNKYCFEEPISDDAAPKGTQNNTLPSRDSVVTSPDSVYCLVNKEYSLPSDYEPDDLVEPDVAFSTEYDSEKKLLRKEASTALEALFRDASKEKVKLIAVSGYRSYDRQKEIYENNLKTRGTTHTNQYSAKPGYSEHQTGLVMDVSCKSENCDLQESFGKTKEGIWLAKNAHTYGYIIRYPQDKCEITGYAYEPWHIRYVGIELATYLHENKLTLDEYFYYKPSYEFITDDSEYMPNTPVKNSSTYTPPSIPATPSSTGTASRELNSVAGTRASKAPVTVSRIPPSAKPSAAPPSVAPKTTTPPETELPAEHIKPSKAPSAKPSSVPSVAPTTTPPSPSPSSDTSTIKPSSPGDNDDKDDSGETSTESVDSF